jgi:hypothetical protein
MSLEEVYTFMKKMHALIYATHLILSKAIKDEWLEMV